MKRQHAVSRLISFGLGAVLLVLTGFSLWAALITEQSVNQGNQAVHFNDLYDQARYAVSIENAAVEQYRNEPQPGTQATFQKAAGTLTASLLAASRDGDQSDQALATQALALHRSYLKIATQFFAAVDSRNRAEIEAAGLNSQAVFTQVNQFVDIAANRYRQQAVESLAELKNLQQIMFLATPLVFGVGLLLLVVFRMHQELQIKHEVLHEVNTDLEALATTDPLTRLPNHRALLEHLDQEVERARRFGRPLSLLFFDADRFKRVNDTYGHVVGDAVLRELAERTRNALRAGDTVGRYGGEEFMALLPETDLEQAKQVAERIRASIASLPVATAEVAGGIHATISIGIATYPTDGDTADEVLEKGDQAMYWAKRLGRNQVRTTIEAQDASHDRTALPITRFLERRDTGSQDALSAEQLSQVDRLGIVSSLMWLLELRDHGMFTHSIETSDLAVAIAREMEQDQQIVYAVSTAAMLHDIGKIAIPDMLLQKTGPFCR
jgi:diguanylate cyclase (GGDEF)-like protein